MTKTNDEELQPEFGECTYPDCQNDADISLDITNGKHLKLNFNPLEWFVIMTGIAVVAAITGVTL